MALELTLLLLAASVLGVVAFRLLNLPPMLGYLVVGIVIGPHALGIGDLCTHSVAGLSRRPQDATAAGRVKPRVREMRKNPHVRHRWPIRPCGNSLDDATNTARATVRAGRDVVDVAERQRRRRRPESAAAPNSAIAPGPGIGMPSPTRSDAPAMSW